MVNLATHLKVVLLSSVTWQWGHFVSPLKSSSRDTELKFPLQANRNLTLPITPLSPQSSTLGRALEEIASDVIYFTVLFLSFSFLPPSLLPYLFMMFAVIGSGLSGHVVEILISSLPSFFPFFHPSSTTPLAPLFPCVSSEAPSWCTTTSLAVHPASFFCSFSFCSSVSWFSRFWRHPVASLSSKALSIMGLLRVGVRGVEVSLCHHFTLFFPIHPSKQERPVFRHLARCWSHPLTTHSRWQHTNNCKLLPLLRSSQSVLTHIFPSISDKTRIQNIYFK